MRFACVIALALCLVAVAVHATADDHTYVADAEVPVFVNVIGPHDNPSETYEYYTLPWCLPPDAVHKHLGLGESLDGNRDVQINSLYDIRFKTDVENKVLCRKELAAADVQEFERAIEQDYYFQMTIDDLPVWGFVGKKEVEEGAGGREDARYYLYTHLSFLVSYKADRVIEVNVVAQRTELTPGKPNDFEFSYSVKWVPTEVEFEHRMDRYTESAFFNKDVEIHWLSILNSAVLAILLCGCLGIILMRILRADCARYMRDVEDADDVDALDEDSGWKVIHGEVFRPPREVSLLAAVLGNGAQIGAIILGTLMLGAAGFIYPYSRGAMYSAAIALFALTAVLNGYVSGSWYKKLNGEQWVRNTIHTGVLFCGPVFIVWAVLNTIAWAYHSAQALAPSTIAALLALWLFVEFPLVVVGAIAGRRFSGPFEAPCRTVMRPRDIPPVPWYRTLSVHVLVAGLLPFCSIYIELFYIFNSVWGRVPYTLYNMLLFAFLILLVVTACVSIALTYFQLAAEDYRWWWRAVLSGGASTVFVFGYAAYYYLYMSEMHGLMQTAFFFGYAALACFAFFLFLGALGFWSSLVFVKRIYQVIKSD